MQSSSRAMQSSSAEDPLTTRAERAMQSAPDDPLAIVLPYSIGARRKIRRKQKLWQQEERRQQQIIAPDEDEDDGRPPLCAEFAARRAAAGWPVPCSLPAEMLVERVYNYDTSAHPLVALLAAVVESDAASLPRLHEDEEVRQWLERPKLTTLGLNPVDRRFKASGGFRKNPSLHSAYIAFLREVVLPTLPHDPQGYLYQKEPNLRCHLPGTGRQLVLRHCDADYFHQPHELNYWLPCTPAYGSNLLWVESAPGRADYRAMELDVGDLLRFYGNQCDHYSLPNETGVTRLSLDFRIVRRSDFVSDYPGSVMSDGKPRFGEGGFFGHLHSSCENEPSAGYASPPSSPPPCSLPPSPPATPQEEEEDDDDELLLNEQLGAAMKAIAMAKRRRDQHAGELRPSRGVKSSWRTPLRVYVTPSARRGYVDSWLVVRDV